MNYWSECPDDGTSSDSTTMLEKLSSESMKKLGIGMGFYCALLCLAAVCTMIKEKVYPPSETPKKVPVEDK